MNVRRFARLFCFILRVCTTTNLSRSERNLLAAAESPWLVKLHCSFQDRWCRSNELSGCVVSHGTCRDNLYFALEYLPGGDFMTLLQVR